MILLPNFNKIEVNQRDKELGSIPASIEWLLKYHQIAKEVNAPKNWAKDFQEKILLGLNNTPPSFTSVVNIIAELFPYFKDKLIYQSFQDSINKFEKIRDLIKSRNGCLISIAQPGWEYYKNNAIIYEDYLSMFMKGQLEEMMKGTRITLFFRIMPVVGYTNSTIIMLNLAGALNNQKIEMKWSDVEILNKFIAGGNDLCFLKLLINR